MKFYITLFFSLLAICSFAKAHKYTIDEFSNGDHILANGKPVYERAKIYKGQEIDMLDVRSIVVIDENSKDKHSLIIMNPKYYKHSLLYDLFPSKKKTSRGNENEISNSPQGHLNNLIGDTLLWVNNLAITTIFSPNEKRVFILEIFSQDSIVSQIELPTYNNKGKMIYFPKDKIWGKNEVAEIQCCLKYTTRISPNTYGQMETIVDLFTILPFKRDE